MYMYNYANTYVMIYNVILTGYFCDVANAPFTSYTSYVCPIGYYCPNGTEFSTQYGCPKGMYGTATQLETPSQCTSCDPGRYCASVGMTTVTGKFFVDNIT